MKIEIGDVVLGALGDNSVWLEVKAVHPQTADMRCRILRSKNGQWGEGPMVKIGRKDIQWVTDPEKFYEGGLAAGKLPRTKFVESL